MRRGNYCLKTITNDELFQCIENSCQAAVYHTLRGSVYTFLTQGHLLSDPVLPPIGILDRMDSIKGFQILRVEARDGLALW